MTDPLRPFTALIRSISKASARDDAGASVHSPAGRNVPSLNARHASAEPVLKSRLKSRLTLAKNASPARRRELFVESVLLAEFGEHLSQDVSFAEMVSRVAEQLQSQADVGKRLDQLLADLAHS